MISSTQEDTAFTTRTLANTSSLHNTVHQLFFKYEPCFGDFELDKNRDVSNQAKGSTERLLLQNGER